MQEGTELLPFLEGLAPLAARLPAREASTAAQHLQAVAGSPQARCSTQVCDTAALLISVNRLWLVSMSVGLLEYMLKPANFSCSIMPLCFTVVRPWKVLPLQFR